MAVGEPEEEPRAGCHVERVIRPVVTQLVNAIVGEVQRVIGIPVKAHCVAYAYRYCGTCQTQHLEEAPGKSTPLNSEQQPLLSEYQCVSASREAMCCCLLDETVLETCQCKYHARSRRLTLCPGLDVSPIQGHAVEGPKGDVAEGPLQKAVIAGGAHVEEEAPRGADADVPAAQTCLKGSESSLFQKLNAALLDRGCSELRGAPVAMVRDVGQPVKDYFPCRQVKGLHST